MLVIVIGVTLMARAQFAQLSTVRLYGARGSLHQCLCQAVPAGQCLLGNACLHPPGQPVHSCVQLSHHLWRRLRLLSHSPACSAIHIHTLDVDDCKWDAYLDLTISECISVYTRIQELGQENLSPFM